jgi:hypothetical protein
VIEVAKSSLKMEVQPVKAFHLEGTLDKDPNRAESERAKASFPAIFDLAVCARLASTPLEGQCFEKGRSALLAWASIYEVSGNPVNEGYFAPVFLASDLILPMLNVDDRSILLRWLKQFATQGDTFFAKMNASDTRLKNNWTAWRLFIRGTVGTIAGDTDLEASTREKLHDFIFENILRDQNGNLLDGKSYDFVQRDALHYHLYDLEPLVRLRLSAPALIDDRSRKAIELALLFLKPFFTGQLRHIEFLHTTVPFDIARAKAGQKEYMNLPWDPTGARQIFRLARPIFPAIQSWTNGVVDVKYDPMIKLLATIYGEAMAP